MEQGARKKILVDKLRDQTSITSTDDDNILLDIHIGNPLRKITLILEEIKRQKAFTFTLKGSLGIMGVLLALSMIGLFGTTHALCDKGLQSHIGTLRALTAVDREEDSIMNKIKRMHEFFTEIATGKKQEQRNEKRTILVTSDHKTIQVIKGRDVSLVALRDQYVVATGQYDSCSQTVKVEQQEEIEVYK